MICCFDILVSIVRPFIVLRAVLDNPRVCEHLFQRQSLARIEDKQLDWSVLNSYNWNTYRQKTYTFNQVLGLETDE